MAFSSSNRKAIIEELQQDKYDLIIVGGGITGAGIALDAASRGMKVALLEMQDFAAGTSSRSTKLVHGGLRYLKQFEIKMVADVGKERSIVYENGPHVTTPEWMLLPFHKGGTFGRFSTSIGLKVYDFLAGVKKSERRRMLSKKTTLQLEPLIKQESLKGGGYYVEYRTDDARLTIEVMKAAEAFGAKVINYVKAEKFLYEKERVVGVEGKDMISGDSLTISGTKVVNATGPWVDEMRDKDTSRNNKKLRLTKGVHLVFSSEKFPLQQAVYFDTPDGRMVFAIPRDGKTYVGTTDTFFDYNKAHPKMTESDRAYILESIAYMFPSMDLSEEDVESSWAGIRPLIYEEGKDPSEISRKDEVWEHDSGLITIAGGKLTGYRKMAQQVVDLVVDRLQQSEGSSFSSSKTKDLPISGGDVGGSKGFDRFIQHKAKEAVSVGLSSEVGRKLTRMYGKNVQHIYDLVKTYEKRDGDKTLPPAIYAQVVYAVQNEMAYTPADFFIRRTGALFFDIDWVRQWKEPVMNVMNELLAWTTDQYKEYEAELNKELVDAVEPAVE
ncbi:glycerol-3-phosphate dehydrogenase/oxidase [Bacillus sp. 2205SS5-2]|uniref:glycerol-3-phosphate dehydrogenase/oxidase n=1 Tax=Bacillus sp. 2205SS5-2 TaxID=3109031 RepID=UPI003005C285